VRSAVKVWKSLFWVAVLAACSAQAWAAQPGFPPQVRVGHTTGDQWEPALAADGLGHVFILYPQYVTVPGCAHCPVPTMALVVSANNGTTWEKPREIAPLGTSQFDAQIVVDPLDRKTVYAAWLQNDKHDVVVAKSVDLGDSWTVVLAGRDAGDLDKPVLTVHGRDVFVAYNHASSVLVSASHDGGTTFTTTLVNARTRRGWAQAGGATVDPAGSVYVSWAAYQRGEEHGQGPVELYVSKSPDNGKTWNTMLLDVSGAPPECATDECGWAYLGAQITIASDSAGTRAAILSESTSRHRRPAVRRGRDAPTSHERESALRMLSRRLWPAPRATCELPGWTPATHPSGIPTTATRRTAARPGPPKLDFPATFLVSPTLSPMASSSPLVTISR